MQLPSIGIARSLAAALAALDYTVEGVRDLLGAVAADALDRSATVPASRVLTSDTSGLAVATRLFLLGESVPLDDFRNVLGEPDDFVDLVVRDRGDLSSAMELAPYASDNHDWLMASDWSSSRSGRPTATDHVLGVGGASTMLAQCTPRPTVGRALDIGTGCGIQAFHLAQHADHVVATDVSERCLKVATFNAALNGIDVELRKGSLFEPVEHQTFDLVVSNPPFVIASPRVGRHDYRDSGMAGDAVCQRLVRGAARHLSDDGWCQLLANWEITDGDDWSRNPRNWLKGSPLDAWVVQRDVQDPAEYVETWLRDAGDQWRGDYRKVYDEWLGALEQRGVRGIGFGLISLRNSGQDQPLRRFQHAPQTLVQPVGPDVERWFAAQRLLAANPGAEVLIQPWRCADDVEVIEESAPSASEPHARSVHRRSGFAWSGSVDDFGVTLLAAADGGAPLADILVRIAESFGVAPEEVLEGAVPIVRRLVEEGFLYLSNSP